MSAVVVALVVVLADSVAVHGEGATGVGEVFELTDSAFDAGFAVVEAHFGDFKFFFDSVVVVVQTIYFLLQPSNTILPLLILQLQLINHLRIMFSPIL